MKKNILNMRITALEETKDNCNEIIRSQKKDLVLKTEYTDKTTTELWQHTKGTGNKKMEYTRVSNDKNHSDKRERQL